jgi:hypothetical protein
MFNEGTRREEACYKPGELLVISYQLMVIGYLCVSEPPDI